MVTMYGVAALIALSAVGAAGTPAHARSLGMGTVTIPVTAGVYRLTLMIGPWEAMYTPAQAQRTHPMTGEIVLRGAMMGGMNMGMGTGTGMSLGMPNRHLEVHVLDRRTMRPASNPLVSITYQALSPVMRRPIPVPVAVLVGLSMDMSDIHYGNNVPMPDGTYRVSVHVNTAYATYTVRL